MKKDRDPAAENSVECPHSTGANRISKLAGSKMKKSSSWVLTVPGAGLEEAKAGSRGNFRVQFVRGIKEARL